ncbi:hypothetical protein ABZ791_02315 [Streptomyces huasconensis]|uniref:Uncharacterized protein n=1 Tax=Streptomyces huasconensis TaxID=1854574 RepID=A0ABV3LRH0_9ACTN
MSEMLTLAGLGGAALSEGIRFLYGQAEELLSRRREERANGVRTETEPSPSAAPTTEPTAPDHAVIERFEQDMRALMDELEPYRAGSASPVLADPANRQLIASAEELRLILSVVHGRSIVPPGKEPAQTVDVQFDVEQVAGYVAGVRGQAPADIKVRLSAGTVEPGARAIGVDFGSGS